jgi:hypothetical protein
MTLTKVVPAACCKDGIELLGRCDPINPRLVFCGFSAKPIDDDHREATIEVIETGNDLSAVDIIRTDGTLETVAVRDKASVSVSDLLADGWHVVPPPKA